MENGCMNSIASRLAFGATVALLIGAAICLATCRAEYCGQPDLQSSVRVAARDVRQPTLAPSRQVVFLRVEADDNDLQVGWAEK
jgi:hypothetical protein